MPHTFLSPIEDVIDDAKNGRMFILVDDEDRENEGDLIIPAEMATAEVVNFMATFGRGLICLPLTAARVEELGLNLMSSHNQSRHQTAFTTSIEARTGVTTGISAADRARTIAVAIDPSCNKYDIATPGHVFPLVARDGGVLVRAGHTEAAVDISKLAGLNPSALICEIMNDDGTMARLPDLIEFAKKHALKVATIKDLISYRLKHEMLVECVHETSFQRQSGKEWKVCVYRSVDDEQETVALVLGTITEDEPISVRMHTLNPFEDMLEMDHPRSGQFSRAMTAIENDGKGIVVLFPSGLGKTPSAMLKQDVSQKKTSALKDYGIGAQILRDLGARHLIIYSNTTNNIIGLEGYGLDIVEQREISES